MNKVGYNSKAASFYIPHPKEIHNIFNGQYSSRIREMNRNTCTEEGAGLNRAGEAGKFG